MGRLEEVPSMKRPLVDPPVQIYWISNNASSLERRWWGFGIVGGCQLRELESTIVASYGLDVGVTADRKGQDRQPL
jgi:hypothetical protein